MTKIKKVQIQKVTILGFKGFKNEYFIEFNPDKTIIRGDNGIGKSSVGDAIAWCFTGKSIFGGVKELMFINKDSKTANVEVFFTDENNTSHTLQRRMNSGTTIKLDGKTINQEKLKEVINTDLFLLIFNPVYFISLDNTSARNEITSFVSEVNYDTVLKHLIESDIEILNNISFNSLDANEYLKVQRKSIKDATERLVYLTGYIENLNKPITLPEDITFNEALLITEEQKLEDLNKQKAPLIEGEELHKKESMLKNRLSELKYSTYERKEELIKLDSELNILKNQLEVVQAKEYTAINSLVLETNLDVLRKDYSRVQTEGKNLRSKSLELDSKKIDYKIGDICPLCKQSLSSHNVEIINQEVNSEINKEKQEIDNKINVKLKTLDELKIEANKLLSQIDEAKKKDDEAKTKFAADKTNEIAKITNEIKTIEAKIASLRELEAKFLADKDVKIKELEKEISALGLEKLEKKNLEIKETFLKKHNEEVSDVKAVIKRLRDEKNIAMTNKANRTLLLNEIEKGKIELTEKQNEMAELNNQVDIYYGRINAIKNYNKAKSLLVNKIVSSLLKDVTIELEKLNETTGEIREVFDIFYKGNEIKICSASEKVRAGLELSDMISSLSGYEYPVFVDNGESITSYQDIALQIIETQVKGNCCLSIFNNGYYEPIFHASLSKSTKKSA